jgi:hypothetical protein
VAALQGRRDEALQYLEEAIQLGYSDGAALEQDSDFESLRDDPIFVNLVQRARAK